MTRYIVARTVTSPRGVTRTARLIVAGTPAGTTVDDVLAALEAAGLGGEFSEAGVPFGNHEIKAEARGAWRNVEGVEQAEAAVWDGPGSPRPEPATVNWDSLNRERRRGEQRRMTLRVTDAELAAYTLASKRAGVSLNEWVVQRLNAAPAAPAASNGTAPAAEAGVIA